jgi:hypothetical protein
MAMLIQERKPGAYDFYHLIYAHNKFTIIHNDENSKNIALDRSKGLANEYINLIHRGTEGIENVKQILKIGPKKDRQKRTIRRVIHIAMKKEQGKVVPFCGNSIDWSHRWLVRGHWRNIQGIGKNRNGDYCIEGKTFVTSHEKGQGDLVHKVRVV